MALPASVSPTSIYSSFPLRPKWSCQAIPGFETFCFPMVYKLMLRFLKVILPDILLSFILCSGLPRQLWLPRQATHHGAFTHPSPSDLACPLPMSPIGDSCSLLNSQLKCHLLQSPSNLITPWKLHHLSTIFHHPCLPATQCTFLWACFDTSNNCLLFFVKPWGSKGQEWDLSYLCIPSTNKASQTPITGNQICLVSNWCSNQQKQICFLSSTLLKNFSHYRREDVLLPVLQITKSHKMKFERFKDWNTISSSYNSRDASHNTL